MSLLSRPSRRSGSSGESPRQVAAALVRQINPGPLWNADQFVAAEARRRRRPITIVESSDLISPDSEITGQLWTREHGDEIVLPPRLNDNERRYTVVHEMGHLLLDHPSRVSPDAWTEWFDALPAHLVRRRIATFTCAIVPSALPTFTDPVVGAAEEEAEWFASLLIAEVDDKRARIAARRGPDKTMQMLDRLARTFGYYN